MFLFERKLIHLTSDHSQVDLLELCVKESAHYVRHTAPPELLRLDEDSEYVVLKDRYPFDVSCLIEKNVPVISLLPSNVFFARGRNSLAKSLAAGFPLSGSIFLLKSTHYSIVPIEIRTFHCDIREMTLREAFDYIFDELYAALPRVLSFDNIEKISSSQIIYDLVEDTPARYSFFQELESVNIVTDKRFPQGLDTLCKDLQRIFRS